MQHQHDSVDIDSDECTCDPWVTNTPWDAKPAIDGVTMLRAQQNYVQAERLYKKGDYLESVPYLVRALEDPNNIEDVIRMVIYLPHKVLAMELFVLIRDTARLHLLRGLGDCFVPGSPYYGRFCGEWGAQPYLGTLLMISRVAIDGGDYGKGIAASNESLELSRDDYIGQRHMPTTIMLLKVGRYDAALVLCQLWSDPKYDRQTFKRLQDQQQLPSFDPLPARVVEYHRTIGSEDVCE
ncbi:hypothetical protein C8Q76DRAFT_794287 [Earliella scabrosa]|nr:hypothetical protein C8Q76DRAFT_794287 [Earliella scabrosa]